MTQPVEEKVCPMCGERFRTERDDDGRVVSLAGDQVVDHLDGEHDAFSKLVEYGPADPDPEDRGHITITLPDGVAADIAVERFRQTDAEGER